MKRVIAIIACGLAAVVLFLAGCSGGNGSGDVPTTRDAAATRGDLTLDISAAGNLALAHTEDLPVDLFFQQATVSEVLVEQGDSVTEGQELVKLDPDEWQTNLDALATAVTTAQRQVDTRQRALDTAKRAQETKQRAVDTRQNALDAARAQITAKQLAVTQAEYNLTTANNTINNLKDVKELQDKIDGIQTDIDTARMILDSISSGHAVAISSTDYTLVLDANYWHTLVNTLEGEKGYYQQRRANLLSGATPMSTDALDLQLQQDQLALQNRQLDLDNARVALTQANQAVTYAQTDLDYANEDVAAAAQDVTYAEQDLASAQDSYDSAVQSLEEAQAMSPVISAPYDGIITRVNIAGGDKVVRNTVAAVIADPSRFEANILVSELDILQVKLGDTATVIADAVSGAVYPATVTFISPTATIQSGVVNYDVTVELDALTPIVNRPSGAFSDNLTTSGNVTADMADRLQEAFDAGRITQEQADQLRQRLESGDFPLPNAGSSADGGTSGTFTPPAGGFGGGGFGGGFSGGLFGGNGGSTQTQSQLPGSVASNYELRQGLTVTVSITIASRQDVILVPNAAVTTTNGQSYVEVVNAGGQTEQRQVEIGLNDWQNTEITSGLDEGETVIVPLNTSPSSSSSSGRIGGGVFGIGR